MTVIIFWLQPIMAIQESYDAGKQLGQSGIALGDVAVHGDGFHQSEDAAAEFKSHNDTTLAEKGGQALQGDMGQLLHESEQMSISAREEHQVNKENSFFKSSLLIEQDPLKETGGNIMQQKSTVTKEVEEDCLEGVSFDVDLINQLSYVPPPRQTINTELTIYYPEYVKKVGRRNDEMGPLPLHQTNYQVNIKRFREYSCPYFTPVDAITGKTYKIDCNRIQNFSLLKVIDRNRVHVTDRYGESCNPVKLIQLSYKHDSYQSEEGSKETWNVLNPADEELVEKHNCHEIKRQCLDSGEKHFDELVVNRPCWKEQITYRCQSDPVDGCKHLKDKNCTLQDGASCVDWSDASKKFCIKWRHPYKCNVTEEVMSSNMQDGQIFCMGGDCHTPEPEANTDMSQSIAQMALMREMAIQDNFIGGNPPKVFPGDAKGCNKFMLGFKNCCQSSGWGVNAGLAACSSEDKQLAIERSHGRCHYIGTYCAEKESLSNICIRKKSVYCCFKSKLARIFHEQGRPQLGKSWGEPENPNCQPFTVDELGQLDFSKMDLREIFADLYDKVDQAATKAVPRQMMDQMPVMQNQIDKMREDNQKSWNSEVYDEQTKRSSF